MSAELTPEQRERLAKALAAAPEGCWDYEPCCWSSAEAMFPVVADMLAQARAEGERRGAVQALEATAQAWQAGGWANVLLPHPTPPAVPTVALSNRVLDWLRDRIEARP